MSIENVDQLKNLIASTLEQRGVLAHLRAELRHHVFLALDEAESRSVKDDTSDLARTQSKDTRDHLKQKKEKIRALHADPVAQDLLELVKEFCEFYELEYSNALLNTEAEGSGHKVNRKQLADKYNCSPSPVAAQPLLLEILKGRAAGGNASNTAAISPTSSSTSRSNRSLYREPLLSSSSANSSFEEFSTTSTSEREQQQQQREKEKEKEKERERERKREREEEEKQKAALDTSEKLSPRDKLSPRGLAKAPLGSLAPLGGSKPSLTSLAPLGSLSKPSLGALSAPPSAKSIPPVQPTLEKKISPVSSTSPTNAASTSSSFSAGSSTYKSTTSSASTPALSSTASAPSSLSRAGISDPLDLDALEGELFGGKKSPSSAAAVASSGSSKSQSFIPGSSSSDAANDESVEYEEDIEVEEEPESKPAPSSSNSLSNKPPSKLSSLSSLSAAPSLKPSSLGSLAPLAPLGRPRATATRSDDESHESLNEEDSRAVAELDKKIASLSAQQQQSKKATVDRSYEDSFTQEATNSSTAVEDDVEEDIEISADEEDYEEEEF